MQDHWWHVEQVPDAVAWKLVAHVDAMLVGKLFEEFSDLVEWRSCKNIHQNVPGLQIDIAL